MNRDPIEESGGLNLYGYILNDPINSIDPFGLQGPRVGWRRPKPSSPLDAARQMNGSWLWAEPSPFPPNWFLAPKCNKLVWDCHRMTYCKPDPSKASKGGSPLYPTVQDVQDPDIDIPGYTPPHSGPFRSGDIVTDGGSHMGIQDANGDWQASSRTGTVFQAPPGTGPGTFNSVWGRSPIQ